SRGCLPVSRRSVSARQWLSAAHTSPSCERERQQPAEVHVARIHLAIKKTRGLLSHASAGRESVGRRIDLAINDHGELLDRVLFLADLHRFGNMLTHRSQRDVICALSGSIAGCWLIGGSRAR